MEYVLVITIAIVAFSLVFDFINGFHDDKCNCYCGFYTCIDTKNSYSSSGNYELYRCTYFYRGIGTITKDIVDPFKLQNGLVVVLAAIIAIVWNWLLGYMVYQVLHLMP